MPNLFALFVLYTWPVLVFFLYRQLPVQRAFIWSILLGYLFMPPASAAFNLPALPIFTKLEIAAVSSAVMALAFHGPSTFKLPKSPIVLILMGAYLFAPVFTVLTNPENVIYGRIVLDGLRIADIPALVFNQLFSLIPFILAYSLLSDFDHLTDLMVAIVIGMLAYSGLILFEIRFSPQLNTWIYGFFQHTFSQMVRGSTFRPIVFLYHALWVGFFTVMGVVAAISLYKNQSHRTTAPFIFSPETMFRPLFRQNPRQIYLLLGLFFVLILLASKSMGPIIFGLSLIVMLFWVSPKWQITAAFLAAIIVLAYPWLRGFQLFPTQLLVDMANTISTERGSSLAFRFLNEDILLARANEKILFGWGAGARHLVLDPFGGRILTVPDGQWIITLGVYGVVGFIGEMGLFLYPVIRAFTYRNISDPKIISPYVAAIALLLAANTVDMIPNATQTPLTFLFAGALWRHLEGVPERLKSAVKKRPDPLFGGVILPYDPEGEKQRTVL